MKGITILVFAYNEEKNISQTLKMIYSNIMKTKISFEIIVLNDGSKDKTKQIVEKIKKKLKKIKLINFDNNAGITRSLKYGIKNSKFDKLTWFPGDNSFSSKNLKNFFLISKKSNLVCGYRYNKKVFNFFRNFLSKLNQNFQSILFAQKIKDVHGIFIFTTKDLKKLKFYCSRYSLMVEILPTILRNKNYKIRHCKVFVNKKTVNSSETLSYQTILDFTFTWVKSFYYYKLN